MQYFLTLLVVFAATSCGRVTVPPDSGTDDFGAGQRSGTRLKLEYFEFEGARQILGIRDSARKEFCIFSRWSDGNSYCTPFGGSEIVFSDASCTTKVGKSSGDACFPVQYFAEVTTTNCEGRLTYSSLYPAGEKRSLARYFTMNGSVCTENPAGGNVFHALGPEIGVGELVRGTVGALEGTGRIQARFTTSSDGLRIAMQPAFDSLLGVDCQLRNDGRCIPSSTAAVAATAYKDSTCTTRAAQIDNRCPKKLVAELDTCSFRSLGAHIQTTSAYFDSGVCQMVPLPPNYSLFDIGAQVTLSTLVRKPVDNGRRIRPIRFADLDIDEETLMYDDEKQSECSPGILADGSVYCFPTGGFVSSQYYTDSGCTTQADIVAVSATTRDCRSTTKPPFATRSTFDPKSCTSAHESRPVGARHAGQLYDKFTGSCGPSSPLYTYYDVGPPLPLSELAKGARLVDE